MLTGDSLKNEAARTLWTLSESWSPHGRRRNRRNGMRKKVPPKYNTAVKMNKNTDPFNFCLVAIFFLLTPTRYTVYVCGYYIIK